MVKRRPVFIATAALPALCASDIASAHPSFILGGGVNLFATRHVAIRPDVEAKIVRRNSQNYVVSAVSVHIAYHFEDHPITPSRSRSRP